MSVGFICRLIVFSFGCSKSTASYDILLIYKNFQYMQRRNCITEAHCVSGPLISYSHLHKSIYCITTVVYVVERTAATKTEGRKTICTN